MANLKASHIVQEDIKGKEYSEALVEQGTSVCNLYEHVLDNEEAGFLPNLREKTF